MICDAFFLQILPNLHAPSLDYLNYLTILYTLWYQKAKYS